MTQAEFPEGATIGQVYGPAMEVQTPEEAAAYLERILRHIQGHNPGMSGDEVRSIAMRNIGYYAGYYDAETMDRVYRLYSTTHPIFGHAHPTAEQAFQKGMDLTKDT